VKKHGDYKGIPQTELQRVTEGLPKVKKSKKSKTPAVVIEAAVNTLVPI
jgi:hypothetical protein